MKLATNLNTVETNVDLSTKSQFKINASAKAFKILSDGLYSNKPLAVVRELSCNAYDAHIENGNEDKPFELGLPSHMDPTFTVRDFGPGLSEESILTLYTTYFESTKTESNDFTGALGLGSKSPFSYTNSFNVVSIHDGVKKFYSAFLSEEGFPQIIKMQETSSDEPSGLEINFAVDPDDFSKFYSATTEYFHHITPHPTMTNYQLPLDGVSDDVLMEGDGWKLFNNSYFETILIQGKVAYPIDYAMLGRFISSDSLISVFKNLSGFVLEVPLGTADIAASREYISYDKYTCEKLSKFLSKVVSSILDQNEELFKNARKENPTQWKYSIELRRLMRQHKFRGFFQHALDENINKFKDKYGKYIENEKLVINREDFPHLSFRGSLVNKVDRLKLKEDDPRRNFIPVPVCNSVALFFNDVRRAGYSRVSAVRSFRDSPDLMVSYRSGNKQAAENEFKDLKKFLGQPTFANVSDLPATVEGFERGRVRGYILDGGFERVREPIEIEKDFIVNLHRESITSSVANVRSGEHLTRILETFTKLKMFKKGNAEIIGLSNREMKRLEKQDDWTDLFQHLQDALVNKLQEPKFVKWVTTCAAIDKCWSTFIDRESAEVTRAINEAMGDGMTLDILNQPAFKDSQSIQDVISKYKMIRKFEDDYMGEYRNLKTLYVFRDYTDTIEPDVDKFLEPFRVFYREFPLLIAWAGSLRGVQKDRSLSAMMESVQMTVARLDQKT